MRRVWLTVGAISGLLAVALGALGAHALKGHVTPDNFELAVRYQMYHALALLALGTVAATGRGGRPVTASGVSFLAGTLLFSGSLYAYSAGGPRWLVHVTPIGGILLMAGWAFLIAVGLKRAGASRP